MPIFWQHCSCTEGRVKLEKSGLQKLAKWEKNRTSFSQPTLISIEFPGPSWGILIPSCSPLDSAGRWNSLRSARPASVQRPRVRSTQCWRCSWLSAPPSSRPSSKPPSPSRQTRPPCTWSPWPGWTGTRQPRSVFPPTSHISDRTASVFSINATAPTYFVHLGYFNDYFYNAMFCFISICESLKVLIAESGQYSMSIIHEHKPAF